MTIDSYSFSDIGGREDNQDALGTKVDGDKGIFVLADGLGGHQNGRMASDCVVNTVLAGWPPEEDTPLTETLESGISEANQAILNMQQEKNCNAKSTAVVLTILGENAAWAHSGDSRLYYLHDGGIAAVTEDHSVAYKKYQAGEITKEEIATDEDQSSLLRVLGSTVRWEPVIDQRERLSPEDAFLLCSDGVWEYVRDDEILVDYLKADSAREWAVLLLLRISARVPKNNDNLSLITVMMKQGS